MEATCRTQSQSIGSWRPPSPYWVREARCRWTALGGAVGVGCARAGPLLSPGGDACQSDVAGPQPLTKLKSSRWASYFCLSL